MLVKSAKLSDYKLKHYFTNNLAKKLGAKIFE
jgi:hypothetical protein